ncbi:plasmid recombination enzyme [Thalassotalea loyana]|uniref:Plasmid recombination enzyme n=1 Tax=Thalassotalea loyana TaxID=280483 RepID=A0ABQ6HCP6_9GAMM|nr:MobV family relaxase [Thalassotalea loyana]GLX85856.1 plasmid recombination enzyme [Thalassotalea loyana]
MDVKTIIRQEKVKTWQQLHSIGAHNNRLKDVPNADPERHIKRLFGSSNLTKDVRELMSKHDIDYTKLRKNAVLCNHMVLSLSPEFFTKGELDYKDTFNKKSIDQFSKRAIKFLKEKYGNKLAHISIHLDESTPHIHAVVVPIYFDDKAKKHKVAAKRFFDKPLLVKMQDEYYQAFKDLPFISKYTHGSNANHKDLKTFYGELEQTKEELAEQELEAKHKVESINNINKNLKERIRGLQAERMELKNQLTQANKKIKSLTDVLEAISDYLFKFTPTLMDKLPKFAKRFLKELKINKEKQREAIIKDNRAKANIDYDLSKLTNLEQEKKEVNLSGKSFLEGKIKYEYPEGGLEKIKSGGFDLALKIEEEKRKKEGIKRKPKPTLKPNKGSM